ncbi:hypothetical protein EL18_02939 [Nitratireductor basaltis]|uniref:Uncharacterized protein n=1 Tax=Nitratireductor basaltis TaxID=472175 RepID=A0A084U6U9_9HYPH|nr:hypothetical protein EL18_02939 [Nitratireductor basaltis]
MEAALSVFNVLTRSWPESGRVSCALAGRLLPAKAIHRDHVETITTRHWITSFHFVDVAPNVEATGNDCKTFSGLFVLTVVHQIVDNRRISQGGGVTQGLGIILRDLAQDAAHDLARACFRQTGGELDLVR